MVRTKLLTPRAPQNGHVKDEAGTVIAIENARLFTELQEERLPPMPGAAHGA